MPLKACFLRKMTMAEIIAIKSKISYITEQETQITKDYYRKAFEVWWKYYNLWQLSLLQSVRDKQIFLFYKVCQGVLQIATSITITNRRPGITKCDGLIKIKITTGRIKCDDYHKLRHYTTVHPADENRAEKLRRWIKWIAHSFSASSLAQFSQPKKNLNLPTSKRERNKRLHGYVVKKIDSTDEMSCSQACLRHSWCTSSNFKESSGNCELNKHEFSTTDDDTKLTDNPGTTFSIFLKVRKVLNFHCLDNKGVRVQTSLIQSACKKK